MRFPFDRLPLKLWTVRALLLVAVLYALQVAPIPGIFMMLAVAAFGPLWGLLPHLMTVGLVADVRARQLPKAALVVPLALYAAYYVVYVREALAIREIEAQIRSANPASIADFDPSWQALVLKDAAGFVQRARIPVVYDERRNLAERYMSYRLLPRAKCDELQAAKLDQVELLAILWTVQPNGPRSRVSSEACIPEMPAAPDKTIIKVTLERKMPAPPPRRKTSSGMTFDYIGLSDVNSTLDETDYHFASGDTTLGTFRSASVSQLAIVPLPYFACMLNDASSSWDCIAMMSRSARRLETYPDSALRALYGTDPIRAMLHIEPREDRDFVHFHAEPENLAFADRLIERKRSESPADRNAWGIRKDSPYLPAIATINGTPSYQGRIYVHKEGGPFRSFIESHVGEVVYIDAEIAGANAGAKRFGLYGTCPKELTCKENHWYDVEAGNGSTYVGPVALGTPAEGLGSTLPQIKGYWLVSETYRNGQELPRQGRKGRPAHAPNGADTLNILTGVTAPPTPSL
ncbi:MAG TPA: hypothetical protein VMU33_18035 [Burkholderiaceae bacterium]|nr:hypothetical protein [Burkholderiaceae bacterium]